MKMLRLILISALVSLAASCTHKELCYDHTHTRNINVVFDWNKAPDANPKSMSLYLFPEDGGRPLRHEFTNKEGGTIRVVAGRYKAICLNSDTRNITVQNEDDFDTFCISTKDVYSVSGLTSNKTNVSTLPKAKGDDEERWVYSPEQVWSGHHDDLLITEHDQTITVTPECHIRNCYVEITNAENLQWITGLSASLSSMAGGHHPSCGMESEELVTIPFDTRYYPKEQSVTGQFTVFGCCPAEDTTHELIIYAILADDSKWYYTYDVTQQIHNAADPYNIYIALNELPLPKPVADGGGFKPSVGEWKEIEINITM